MSSSGKGSGPGGCQRLRKEQGAGPSGVGPLREKVPRGHGRLAQRHGVKRSAGLWGGREATGRRWLFLEPMWTQALCGRRPVSGCLVTVTGRVQLGTVAPTCRRGPGGWFLVGGSPCSPPAADLVFEPRPRPGTAQPGAVLVGDPEGALGLFGVLFPGPAAHVKCPPRPASKAAPTVLSPICSAWLGLLVGQLAAV